MAKPAPKYGHMNCEGCASDGKTTRVLVRKNERGTLSAPCDECDATDYAQAGSEKHARWERKIEKLAAPAPAPAPDEPEKKPAAGKYGKYA